MIVTKLILKNWRNFRAVEVALDDRVFLVGPNAAGKSNFLEVFRFLRDIAKSEGGGLQNAVAEAGGLKKIRCLGRAARRTWKLRSTWATVRASQRSGNMRLE